ncbi:hypothetical protein PAHAL_9G032800 [Panicum hallii]|uniref:FBD domain-containing protein n=1 Tax=Panicum hallii TaxID=206008 RepID=A0A2S3IGT6_9POAL|nr:hypothetical protein PAHAL_9G032800 [Panicum hallii]
MISSTAAMEAAEDKQMNQSLSGDDDHVGADDDRISSLGDDVLARILGLVADARAVVRTGALSRRWLGVWTRVAALRFDSWPEFVSARGAARYLAFVSDVLALRARSDAGLERLAISFIMNCAPDLSPFVPASITAAPAWIRHAMHQGVRSFTFDLRLPPTKPEEEGDHDDSDLETMRLALGGTRVRLPATVAYMSLADLSLERINVVGSGVDLAGLLSPASCPSVERLRLKNLSFSSQGDLRLESGVLTELWLENVCSLEALDLRSPSLRFLHVKDCRHEALKISTPNLQELRFVQTTHPLQLEVEGDLLSVRRLNLHLYSHAYAGREETANDVSALLLEHCSSATSLDVILHVPKDKGLGLIEGTIPLLPHVKCLTVHVSPRFSWHAFGTGFASLLAQFISLRSLRVHLDCFLKREYHAGHADPDTCHFFSCYDLDRWRWRDIPLAHLQEIELRGLRGTRCELGFLQFMVTGAAGLQKVTTSFSSYGSIEGRRDDGFDLTLLDGGTWTARRYAYQPFDSRPCNGAYLQGQVHVYSRNAPE